MAYSDPQSVTINAVANSLPRTASTASSSEYTKDDGTVKLSISHQYGKRNRRQIRLQHSKTSADPLIPATNRPYNMACYIVVDVPVYGYTNAEAKQIVDALTAYLTASSGANVTKLLGGES